MISKLFLRRLFLFVWVIYFNPLSAQIGYVYFNENIGYNQQSIFTFNLGPPGSDDFQFTYQKAYSFDGLYKHWLYLKSISPSYSYFAADNYVDTLNYGDIISDEVYSWHFEQKCLIYYNAYTGELLGTWLEGKDYYVGLKIKINDQYHFGWLRGEVTITSCALIFKIKDMAYNTQPEEPIFAGEGILNCAQDLEVRDIGNNKNGTDLYYEFQKAFDEPSLVEYRLMVVKEEQASTFILDSANTVQPENYLSRTPVFSIYSGTFFPSSTTTDGSLITNLQPYYVFVLSIDSSGISENNVLSPPSEKIMLTCPTEKVASVGVMDINNNGNGSDMVVIFPKVNNEQKISEYRIMCVEASTAGSFTIEDAGEVPQGNYTPVIPEGFGEYTVFLSDTTKDINGIPVSDTIAYYLFVLSAPDGVITDYYALSDRSNRIALTDPNYLFAGQTAFGPIEYIDIVPNIPFPHNDTISIDFDNDSIYDIEISRYSYEVPTSASFAIYIITKNGWAFAGNKESGDIYKHPYKINKFQKIHAALVWKYGTGYLWYYFYCVGLEVHEEGYWKPNSSGYIGLRKFTDTDTLYAWVRIQYYTIYDLAILHYGTLIAPDYTYTINGLEVNFQNHSLNATSYTWHFGDGDTSNLFEPTHIYPSYNNYEVKLIARNEFSSDSLIQTILLMDIEDIIQKEPIKIYPNPNRGICYIQLNNIQNNDIELKIFNAQGILVSSHARIEKCGMNFKLDFSHLKKGLYFIKLSIKDQSFTEKIIILKE